MMVLNVIGAWVGTLAFGVAGTVLVSASTGVFFHWLFPRIVAPLILLGCSLSFLLLVRDL